MSAHADPDCARVVSRSGAVQSPSKEQQAAWQQADLYLVDNPLAEHTSPITGKPPVHLLLH